MKKPLVVVLATVAIVIVAYLAYALFRPRLTPCESIFQQTSLKLGASLAVIKARGPDVSIEETKIQDLTERSQGIALNLKTCCIVLEGGKLSADEFLRCKQNAETFEAHVENVASTIDEAQAAKQRGKPEVHHRTVDVINEDIESAKAQSDRLTTRVTQLRGAPPGGAPTETRTGAETRRPRVQPAAGPEPVALPARREYTLGRAPGVTYTLLKADVSPKNSKEDSLTLRVRMINNAGYAKNFWSDSFRLVVDGLPMAPDNDLNELVKARAGKDGEVRFVFPHGTSAATLKILYGGDSADIPLELSRAPQ